MASDSPAWLSEDSGPPTVQDSAVPSATAADGNNDAAATTTTTASPRSKTSAVSATDERDLPQVILMMRLMNMGLAVAVITISVLLMLSLPTVSAFVLAIYAICGGMLVCCLETQLKFLRVMIAVNFGFLFNSYWRFLFYLIMASVCWSYNRLMGQIVAIAFVVVAFFNTYVLCRYPAYREMRERIAQEEDKRIEARISKEIRRQAVNQVVGNNNASMSSGI